MCAPVTSTSSMAPQSGVRKYKAKGKRLNGSSEDFKPTFVFFGLLKATAGNLSHLSSANYNSIQATCSFTSGLGTCSLLCLHSPSFPHVVTLLVPTLFQVSATKCLLNFEISNTLTPHALSQGLCLIPAVCCCISRSLNLLGHSRTLVSAECRYDINELM